MITLSSTRVVVGFAFALTLVPGGAASGSVCGSATVLDVAGAKRLADLGCRLTGRIVRSGHAAVGIPAAGRAVSAHVLTTGGEDAVTVAVDAGGRLRIDIPRAAAGAAAGRHDVPAGPTVEPPECFSSARQQQTGFRRPPDRALNWFYNGSGEPRAGMYMAVWLGADHMTYGVNDCGLAPGVFGISHLAAPGSLHRADIYSNSWCSISHDDLNVVDWGGLPDDVLAVACSRTIVTVPCILGPTCFTSSDVRFNSNKPWFVADEVPEPAAQPLCFGARASTFTGYDLMSVSAHEFGHVWGLGHVSESTDPRMTMSTRSGICDFSGRFLGLGDHFGMCERWCEPLTFVRRS